MAWQLKEWSPAFVRSSTVSSDLCSLIELLSSMGRTCCSNGDAHSKCIWGPSRSTTAGPALSLQVQAHSPCEAAAAVPSMGVHAGCIYVAAMRAPHTLIDVDITVGTLIAMRALEHRGDGRRQLEVAWAGGRGCLCLQGTHAGSKALQGLQGAVPWTKCMGVMERMGTRERAPQLPQQAPHPPLNLKAEACPSLPGWSPKRPRGSCV